MATDTLANLIQQFMAAHTKAQAANEQRYQDILGQYETLGQAGMTRIGQQQGQQSAESAQDMISRGLSNTTMGAAADRGIADTAEAQRQQLQESVVQQKAGVMERRTDQGPDMGMFANLLQAAQPQKRERFRNGQSIGFKTDAEWTALTGYNFAQGGTQRTTYGLGSQAKNPRATW